MWEFQCYLATSAEHSSIRFKLNVRVLMLDIGGTPLALIGIEYVYLH